MAQTPNIPNLERITFFEGQRLTARDLTTLQRAHRELRWLHNRSLHSWGIGIGLSVTGERGDSAVSIEPGYGVDCLGREIILTEPLTMPVPAKAAGPNGGEAVYYLIAAYQPNEDQQVAERRAGVCLPEGTVRLSEEPLIEWRTPHQLQKSGEGFQLVLAQAWLQNCQLSRPLSLTPRRYARPSHQPYIAAGQTPVGNTVWQPWRVDDGTDAGTTVGVCTRVDTKAARFRTMPYYIAHVVGNRYFSLGEEGEEPSRVLVSGFASVSDATPYAFTLQVLLPEIFSERLPTLNPRDVVNTNTDQLISAIHKKWHVAWMGIEG